MSEHRTPEVKTIISELEKKIKEEDRKAYVDPVKAEEAKEKGNEFFNKGSYFIVVMIYLRRELQLLHKNLVFRPNHLKIGILFITNYAKKNHLNTRT